MSAAASSSSSSSSAVKDGFFYSAAPALASGAVQAITFNPIDRALYVRVKNRRKRFLDWRNFQRPFQGFMNAAVYRTLVGASYMFWQDTVRILIERYFPECVQANVSPQLNSVVLGLTAGAVNGFALNTLQAVKFRMWNTDDKGATFARTARLMFNEGGVAIFFRGCITTMVRDSVFGVVYETVRRSYAWKEYFDRTVRAWMESRSSSSSVTEPEATTSSTTPQDEHYAQGNEVLPHRHSNCGTCAFISNLLAAVLASMLSSPFNYVRSIFYSTPPGAIPLGYVSLLRSFYTQVYYIYRNGRSYTDSRSVPELSEAEHNVQRTNGGGGNGSGNGSSRPLGNGAEPQQQRVSTGSSTNNNRLFRLHHRVSHWANTNHHHPIAAWRWANSRLNIGWGSLRVGLGMAMSQSLFHLAQDYVRAKKTSL